MSWLSVIFIPRYVFVVMQNGVGFLEETLPEFSLSPLGVSHYIYHVDAFRNVMVYFVLLR